MNILLQKFADYFDKYFNAKNVRKVELLILRVAVFAFLLHLIIIFLGNNAKYFSWKALAENQTRAGWV